MIFFWLIFITLMLPVEVRIVPTYEVVANFGTAEQLFRAHPAADRLRDSHVPLPAILHDGAG
jgi:hypothetical protein